MIVAAITKNSEVNWSLANKIFSCGASEDCTSFGSEHWAFVYLAGTPQQAAAMGLKFPGVDEVENIDDFDGNSDDPFVADAIANERESWFFLKSKEKIKEGYADCNENMDGGMIYL